MRKKDRYLLVDGYNIVFAWKELAGLAAESIADARDKLAEDLEKFASVTDEKVIVVFDAYRVKDGIGSVERRGPITVIFTREAETADAYIEKASSVLAREYSVRVATGDALEQVIILSHGATRVSPGELALEMSEARRLTRERIAALRPIKKNALIENLDMATAEWLEKLRLNRKL
ncbi:MAG: NYN domain-containing protein [Clostridiales bacterium]|nr:NYN domain-containing protein [Clostridiales bacterium]